MGKSKRRYGKRGRRRRTKKRGKSARRSGRRKTKSLAIKKQFRRAVAKLQRMRPVKQREAMLTASPEFIRDVSNFFKQIRHKAHLVKPKHRQVIKRHKKEFRKLIDPRTPIALKRVMLYQKGGQFGEIIIPAIISAIIGAGGSVAGSAAAAAVMKKG